MPTRRVAMHVIEVVLRMRNECGGSQWGTHSLAASQVPDDTRGSRYVHRC